MKTLKFLILICIFAVFSVGTANSQVHRWVNTETYHETSIWFGCIDEPLTGDMVWTYTYTWKEDNGFLKWQEKYKGTLTGDISGDIYTISFVANDHSVSMVNVNGHWTGNWYYVQTFTIEKDGIPVSTYHRLIHGTGNTNSFENKGDWAAYVDNEWFECF
jgi:hypothetical protein